METPRSRWRLKSFFLGMLGMATALAIVFVVKRLFIRRDRSIVQQHSVVAPVVPEQLPGQWQASSLHSFNLPGKPMDDGRDDACHRPAKKQWFRGTGYVVMALVIAGTFVFSTHVFSSYLLQPDILPAAAARVQLLRPAFERGIIYPQWSPQAYGTQDSVWQQEIGPVKTQTESQWIELPVLFSQASPSATVVGSVYSTTQVSSFVEGIQHAHALGYRVFFVPLMQVRQPGMWSGSITFSTMQQEQAWFDSYWQAIEPYVAAAADQHVEQMAIGTELQTLQAIAPASLWSQLIARVRGVFHNTLTYDMNWSSLGTPMPSWMKNPALTYIGVSAYVPLLTVAGRIAPEAIPALWRVKVKDSLDALATQVGKPVLITEIGYRNSSDALYRTWEAQTSAPSDPQEQAGAYTAALSNVFQDPQIAGTFFWGWDDVGRFAIKGQPAQQVLLHWYSLTTTQA